MPKFGFIRMCRTWIYWSKAQLKRVAARSFEWWAILATISYISLFLGLLVIKFDELESMALNELGDFAAGFFGPPAFLWLVLGYRQQGKELAASTLALEQQASELRAAFALQQENAAKQDKMLDPVLSVLPGQADVYGDESYEPLRLVNYGSVCKHVEIDFESLDGSGRTCMGVIFGQLNTDGSQNFQGPRYAGANLWRIIVRYTRVNGSKSQQAFIVTRVPGGKLHIMHEVESG